MDWSSIQCDIVLLISSKIDSVDDYIRFSAVCRSWNSLATDPTNYKPSPNFVPLYMSGEPNTITLRNPTSDRALTLTLTLPSPGGRIFWGSPFGWLVAFHLKQFTLLNPFSRAAIDLPADPQGILKADFRGYLTASPDSDPDNFTVLLVAKDHKIALFKPATTTRTRTKKKKDMKWTFRDLEFDGVTYFGGHLYGIQSYPTRVVSFQNDRFVPVVTLLHHPELYDPRDCSSEKYLVELDDGQLCLCVRYYFSLHNDTQGYKFFEIDLSTGKLTLVTSLGGRCVFINPNYSFSCKASYPPTRLFEQHHHQYGFVSNYVFYSALYYDTEVWDVLRSCIVHERRPDSPSDIQSLWIIPPVYKAKNTLIQFH